jgi:hypothetical protein
MELLVCLVADLVDTRHPDGASYTGVTPDLLDDI